MRSRPLAKHSTARDAVSKNSHVPLAEDPAVKALLEELARDRKWEPVFGKDHAQNRTWSGMMTRRKIIRSKGGAATLPPDELAAAAQRLQGAATPSTAPPSQRRCTASPRWRAVRQRSRARPRRGCAQRRRRVSRRARHHVSLLTLHAAKGLEFAVVFLVGCEDGLLPLRLPGGAPADEDVAEERRLFFVGLTRAQDRLYLSHAARRYRYGSERETSPSPFLATSGTGW
jgi:hypothetical protein